MSQPNQLLIVADYLEEGWPSMDLAADMLEQYWPASSGVKARLLRPRMYRPLQGIPLLGRRRAAFNAERFFGRFTRSITLTKQVDSGKVKASYKDGVLTVTLPKAEEAKPRQIQIKG